MEEYVKRWFQYIEQYVVGLEQALDKRGKMLAQSEADINTERANTERAREAYNSLLADYERLKAGGPVPATPDSGRMESLRSEISDYLDCTGNAELVAELIVEIAREANKEER